VTCSLQRPQQSGLGLGRGNEQHEPCPGCAPRASWGMQPRHCCASSAQGVHTYSRRDAPGPSRADCADIPANFKMGLRFGLLPAIGVDAIAHVEMCVVYTPTKGQQKREGHVHSSNCMSRATVFMRRRVLVDVADPHPGACNYNTARGTTNSTIGHHC